MDMRTEFGTIYDDQLFAELYSERGRPVEVTPWRLALVTVMQYIKGLNDRQTADAVRRGMDWKYALSLELADPGFNFTCPVKISMRPCGGNTSAAHRAAPGTRLAPVTRAMLCAFIMISLHHNHRPWLTGHRGR